MLTPREGISPQRRRERGEDKEEDFMEKKEKKNANHKVH
jgi:hypothetical protein